MKWLVAALLFSTACARPHPLPKPTPIIDTRAAEAEKQKRLKDFIKFCWPDYEYAPDEVPTIVKCPPLPHAPEPVL